MIMSFHWIKILVVVFFSFFLISFDSYQKDFDKEFGRDHNVCKKFKGNVLLYVVWVETRVSEKWTDFDLNTTVDSVKYAVNWLNKMADINAVELKLFFDTSHSDSLSAIYQKLDADIPDLITNSEGLDKIDKWSNKLIRIQSGEKTKISLISSLRNKYNVESVALVFMMNNYYKEDYVYTFNTTSNSNIEYSVVNSKRPVIIAQNILSLFGAPYLYHHPSTTNKRDTKQLQKIFADDVMANTDKFLEKCEIGEITRYFIGWTDSLTEEYEKMVKEKTKI